MVQSCKCNIDLIFLHYLAHYAGKLLFFVLKIASFFMIQGRLKLLKIERRTDVKQFLSERSFFDRRQCILGSFSIYTVFVY